MSEYKKRSGSIELHYGYDEEYGEYWYEVYDLTRKHINGGLVESAGSTSTGMPQLVLAEKLKQFNCDPEHVKKVLWMKKI